MIIIKLWGGLGNQLFQYAFGYQLAKKTGQELKFDCSFYGNQPGFTGKRAVEISSLSIPIFEQYAPERMIKVLSNRYIGAILRKLPAVFIPVRNGMKYLKEPIHKYLPDLQCDGSVYFDGYWQSAKYFRDVRNELMEQYLPRKGFSEVELDLFAMLQAENSVAVHIRKGDFATNTVRKVGHLLPISYYKNAMEYFRKNINAPIFYIVSDDPTWAKQQFKEENDVKYIADLHQGNMLTDLYCIANCRNGIMSASTFSWWGNWLREKKGMVIVPRGEYYNECFYEPEWIQIDFNEVIK